MDTNSSNPESREALLRDMALRFAISPYDPRTQNPQLFVGQLPENLPFEVPIPDGSRVIGSLVRSSEHIDIILDVPLPPGQALAFYKEQLQAAGWDEPEQPMGIPHSGFVHSRMLALSLDTMFCKGPRGPSLHFSARGAQAGFTDVRLDLNLDERESPCAQESRMQRERRMHGRGFEQLIPPLEPPAGAQQMGGGGGVVLIAGIRRLP